jgi:eukaryotic-like serine/threonine-protein kinase
MRAVEIGSVIAGGYRVMRHLGSGGMGDVYEAERQGERFAVKVLAETGVAAVRRFEQEARAMSRLRSPRIARVVDFRSAGDVVFLVMELLDGETLQQRLRLQRPLPAATAARIASAMLEALSAAHEGGVVHRDIKPSNVFLVSPDAQVKLIDFGVAKLFADNLVSTTTGSIVGTPVYMAPEQLRGVGVGPWTDIHAVGVCFFEMLAGRRPWRATAPSELMAEILRDAPLALASIRPDLPPAWGAIVERALAKDPRDRFAGASQMRAAIGALPAPPDSARSRALPEPHVNLPTTRVAPPDPHAETMLPVASKATRTAALVGTLVAGGLTLTVVVLRMTTPAPPAPAPTPVSAPAPPPLVPVPTSAPADLRPAIEAEEATWRAMLSLGRAPDWPGGPNDVCYCAYDGVWPGLCSQPQRGHCYCEYAGATACPEAVPVGEECKSDGAAWADGVSGTPCAGFIGGLDRTAKRVDGRLSCNACADADVRVGTHGAPCRGVSSRALPHDGKLVCGRGPPPKGVGSLIRQSPGPRAGMRF